MSNQKFWRRFVNSSIDTIISFTLPWSFFFSTLSIFVTISRALFVFLTRIKAKTAFSNAFSISSTISLKLFKEIVQSLQLNFYTSVASHLQTTMDTAWESSDMSSDLAILYLQGMHSVVTVLCQSRKSTELQKTSAMSKFIWVHYHFFWHSLPFSFHFWMLFFLGKISWISINFLKAIEVYDKRRDFLCHRFLVKANAEQTRWRVFALLLEGTLHTAKFLIFSEYYPRISRDANHRDDFIHRSQKNKFGVVSDGIDGHHWRLYI